MRKPYLILGVFLALLIWFLLAKSQFIDRTRPALADLFSFPMKALNKSVGALYNVTMPRNSYERKIADLEQKVSLLTKEAVGQKGVLQENERFRGLLGFKAKVSQKTIAAEVTGRDLSNWDSFVIIDKGSADGIKPSMTVAKEDGLVGVTFEVGASMTKVMLIDNPNSRISATIQRTREQGVVVGLGAGLCKMVYLAYDTDCKPGDLAVANGPILIGEIIKVLKDPHSLYTSVIIKPSSNLFKIEEVLCIE